MRADTLDIGGVSTRVWRGGRGPQRLVLLQGGMADAALHWDRVWDALAERFDVIAPDWPGFGASAPLPTPTWPAMLGWLAALIDETAGGRAHLVGNSFGATVARFFAAAHPERTDRIVLVNGGGMVPPATAEALKALPGDTATLAAAGRAAFTREALARMVARESTLTDDFLAAAQANGAILGILKASLAGSAPADGPLAAPALVLWGEADRHSAPDVGRVVATALGAAFQTIAGAGHLPQIENPEAVVAVLSTFLDPDSP